MVWYHTPCCCIRGTICTIYLQNKGQIKYWTAKNLAVDSMLELHACVTSNTEECMCVCVGLRWVFLSPELSHWQPSPCEHLQQQWETGDCLHTMPVYPRWERGRGGGGVYCGVREGRNVFPRPSLRLTSSKTGSHVSRGPMASALPISSPLVFTPT